MTVRQQIIDAIKTRFQSITTANGYATNAGSNVFVWRATPFEDPELPGINIRDTQEEVQPQSAGVHHRKLTVEADALAANGSATPEALRSLLADIEKAIGADRFWTVGSVRLAFNTEPLNSELAVDHEQKIVGGARYRFTLHYRTKSFDSYNQ